LHNIKFYVLANGALEVTGFKLTNSIRANHSFITEYFVNSTSELARKNIYFSDNLFTIESRRMNLKYTLLVLMDMTRSPDIYM